jgi:hypothetical protein
MHIFALAPRVFGRFTGQSKYELLWERGGCQPKL